jgi:hypothetical protein
MDGTEGSRPYYYNGDGDRIVVLIDNVRDTNFFDPLDANGRTFIAGFVSNYILVMCLIGYIAQGPTLPTTTHLITAKMIHLRGVPKSLIEWIYWNLSPSKFEIFVKTTLSEC